MYILTDGRPATRKDCEDTICSFTSENVHSIDVSQNGKAISFMSILEGYSLSAADDLRFQNLCLSVQSNNISGPAFWRKLRFYEVSRCACNGFDNLSMKYDICRLPVLP